MRNEWWASPLPLVGTGLTKGFGERSLWGAINLAIEPGEMVAITGPSGSGKTTLLNSIGLLEPLDSGTLSIGGRSLRFSHARERRNFYRHGVGFLFQNYGLVESWSVVDNLNLALTYSPRSRIERRDARSAVLELLNIDSLANHRIFTLSGGEQQRVALARLLLQNPRLVLADEPTASLDTANADMVIEQLRSLRDRSAIVLVSTHDPRVIAACDRQISLPGAARLPRMGLDADLIPA